MSSIFRDELSLSWNTDDEVGVPEIDSEHRGIINAFNTFNEVIKNGFDNGHVSRVFNILSDYSCSHFKNEEAVMERYSYPCLLYTSPSPRDGLLSRMPYSA